MNIQQLDFHIDIAQVLLWHYNRAAKLESLVTQKQTWYDLYQEEFWNDWFNNIFNLLTANDFGCAVWSIILQQPLQIGAGPDPDGKPIFGFTTVNNSYLNFTNSNFSNNGSNVSLTLEEKRVILRLRYWQLVSRGAIPETNFIFQKIFFDYPPIYVMDGLDMTIVVVFTENPGTNLLYFIQHYDLIPRPSGVKLRYIIQPDAVFGFGSETAELNGNKNFENGTFLAE